MGEEFAMHEESRPLSQELRIDAACRSFEAAWKAADAGGTPPRLEDYLTTEGDADRWPLLHELLMLELRFSLAPRAGPGRMPAFAPAARGRPAGALPTGAGQHDH